MSLIRHLSLSRSLLYIPSFPYTHPHRHTPSITPICLLLVLLARSLHTHTHSLSLSPYPRSLPILLHTHSPRERGPELVEHTRVERDTVSEQLDYAFWS